MRHIGVPRHELFALLGGMLLCFAPATYAFEIPPHMELTRTALGNVHETISGRQVTFSDRAIQQICDANEATDGILNGSAALYHPERHFTNERFPAASQRLMDIKQQILDALRAQRPDGPHARELFGTAIHAVQDFYAHSNWVELGNTGFNNALGRSVMPAANADDHPCPTNHNPLGPNGGGTLTSGYYLNKCGCDLSLVPAGKCLHGTYFSGFFSNACRPFCDGINKDRPEEDGYTAAHSAAADATADYLEQILSQIRGNDKAVAAFLDVRGTLAFIVDDTGSMGEEIDGVKSVINQIIAIVSTDPDLRPDEYMLVRFGDPDVGAPFQTQDPGALLGAVSGLFPHGGGDCPELSQTGLLNAVNAGFPFSKMFLFTDATAKDPGAASSAILTAQDKSTEFYYALTGSCSPIDPAYIRGAHETGGQLFLINQFEIPQLVDLFLPRLSSNLSRIRSEDGTLTGPRLYDFPVDGTVTKLIVSLAAGSASMTLTDPSGATVTTSTPGAHLTALTGLQIWTITGPAVGLWHVSLTGANTFDLVIDANSGIEFRRFAFVTPNDDPHGGLLPRSGQPARGEEAYASAIVFGPIGATSFSLLDASGAVVGAPALARNTPSTDPLAFVGTVSVPAVPFHVVATGLASDGTAFRREFPTQFTPQVVTLAVTGPGNVLVAAGVHVDLAFVVHNLSSGSLPLTFTATDVRGYGKTVSPTSATVPPNDSATVTVGVDVASNASPGDTDPVTLVASSPSDPTIANSATVTLQVGTNSPPDCSGMAAFQPQMWPPNKKFTTFDLASYGRVTDPDGDALTWQILGVTSDETNSGPGPDFQITGPSTVMLRADRADSGDGRVYTVSFSVSDGNGGSCTGTFEVGVPHDLRPASGPPKVVPVWTEAALARDGWVLWAQPSPSHGPVVIGLAIRDPRHVGEASLTVNDVAGRTVRTWSLGHLAVGTMKVTWDGADDRGNTVRPGVYYLALRVGDTQTVRTHVVTR
jgi:flagellar hook capping protein FlgD